MFKDKVDILTRLLECQDIFSEESIIDTLIDYFLAAATTTSAALQALSSHFIKDKIVLQKVREEFDELRKGREQEDLSKVLSDLCTIDKVTDFEYLDMVIKENFRFMTPVPSESLKCTL